MKIKHMIIATSLLAAINTSFAATHAIIKTTQGDIEIELNEKAAPITTKNFIQYAKSGFYTGTIFHRSIPNFMIQGGGFDKNMKEKTGRAPIKNEANNGLQNLRGTISMARTQIKDSATSQFFINLNNNNALDHGQRDFGYAVFGKVVNGMDVVDKIAKLPTTTKGMHANVPKQDITILSVKIINTK